MAGAACSANGPRARADVPTCPEQHLHLAAGGDAAWRGARPSGTPSASAFRFQRRTALGSHPDHCGYRCEGAPPRAPASLRPRQLVSLPHLRSRRLGRSLPADPEDEAVRDKPQQEILYGGMSRTGSGQPGPGGRAGAPTGSAAKRRDSSDGPGTGDQGRLARNVFSGPRPSAARSAPRAARPAPRIGPERPENRRDIRAEWPRLVLVTEPCGAMAS